VVPGYNRIQVLRKDCKHQIRKVYVTSLPAGKLPSESSPSRDMVASPDNFSIGLKVYRVKSSQLSISKGMQTNPAVEEKSKGLPVNSSSRKEDSLTFGRQIKQTAGPLYASCNFTSYLDCLTSHGILNFYLTDLFFSSY